MPPTASLVSLNIEHSKHLDAILPFLRERQPDFACLQEVEEHDFFRLQDELGLRGIYAPMCDIATEPDAPATSTRLGLAIFSKHEPDAWRTTYYGGFSGERALLDPTIKYIHTALLWGRYGQFSLATTHLTWTQNGEATPGQLHNLDRLLGEVGNHPEIVFCGDFNAPRGRESWSRLAAAYTDNVPADITTTIDAKIHRAGDLQLVVDGLFSTSGYTVSEVEVIDGLSDHCAVTG